MITKFTIKNFRRFNELTIDPLARFTLINGPNASGKTSLLEALWAFVGANRPKILFDIDHFRGTFEFINSKALINSKFLVSSFHNLNNKQPIEFFTRNSLSELDYSKLKIELKGNQILSVYESINSSTERLNHYIDFYHIVNTYSSRIKSNRYKNFISKVWPVFNVKELDPYTLDQVYSSHRYNHPLHNLRELRKPIPNIKNARFITSRFRTPTSELADTFSNLENSKIKDILLEIVTLFEPSLHKLNILPKNNISVVHAELKNGLTLPINLIGEGFIRAFEISLGFLLGTNGGIILIDEIENGLYYKAYKDFFTKLYLLSKMYNVQVVATTHSRDVVMQMYHALKDKEDNDFIYHRIDETKDGNIELETYNIEDMSIAEEYNMEIR